MPVPHESEPAQSEEARDQDITQRAIMTSPLPEGHIPVRRSTFWRWIVWLMVAGSLYYGGMLLFFMLGSACTPSGSADLQRLDALPETRLVPPQSHILERTSHDATCSIESSYDVYVLLEVSTPRTTAETLAFYHQALKNAGWQNLDDDFDRMYERYGLTPLPRDTNEQRWLKGEQTLELLIRDPSARPTQHYVNPAQTHYRLLVSESKGP